MTAPGPAPRVVRRNHGRNHSYTIDGIKVPGVTTVTGMTPKTALIEWAGRTTAEYAVDNWDELAALKYSARLNRINRARYAERDTAARRGTQVHKLAEHLVAGESVDVPDELAGHVDAYVDFLDRTRIKPVAIELVIANFAHRYCGTLDLIGDMPALLYGGDIIPPGRWLLDLKTSRSGIFRESALQVCGYKHGDVYLDPDTGAERPVRNLRIDHTGAVHVRADGWDLRPVDTGPVTWQYFTRLRWLLEHDEDADGWVGDAIEPPPLDEAAS